MYNADYVQKVLECLRDFFYFGTQSRMKEAYEELCRINGDMVKETDWVEEEYCFNRLFVGPAAPLAPMLASYYLEEDTSYNGEVTTSIREIYRTIGLDIPEGVNIPEDSLPFELDACRYLMLITKVTGDALPLYGYFVRKHMNEWLPLFLRKAEEHEKTVAVGYVLIILKRWILSAVDELTAQEV